MVWRSYTVGEIDALRNACEQRYMFGTTKMRTGVTIGRSYKEPDKAVCVEEMVRTFMLAGVTAKDIYEQDEANPRASP